MENLKACSSPDVRTALKSHITKHGPVPTVLVSTARTPAQYRYYGAVRYEVRILRDGRLANMAVGRAKSDRRSRSKAWEDAHKIWVEEGRLLRPERGVLDEIDQVHLAELMQTKLGVGLPGLHCEGAVTDAVCSPPVMYRTRYERLLEDAS